MKIIQTNSAPAAVGPYSQAVETDNFVFASGQIALNPATGEMAEGIEAQAHQALKNAQAVIAASGAKWENVIKTTVFITNIDDFGKVNEIYATYFKQPYPARSCVEVSKLPKGALIEVEVIAAK
ncbi:RidA family protein [Megamonas hypermegale]|uniref:RidA family protein n=1 Tax=Megamonas hypermegale TaxID=158847 RepID=UPI0025A3174F|nr:RidA family protein [Megamonas hypermegale]MDM8142991.1 RidA family protein [Megamonas hypermegale]